MAKVKSIGESSPFIGKILPGDELISVNNEKINDLLDYMYFTSQENTVMKFTVLRNGSEISYSAKINGDPGIEYDQFLMDRERSCSNNCVFCFIAQMPDNMRETLYYKDDDFRLGLIYGNYITLTNVNDYDFERIIRLHISPLNISVHTTNPELRVKMLKNPRASKIMDQLHKLSNAGIRLKCQIVLCRGLNDGAELDRSLNDLETLYPSISSVSIVPVGLTKFREKLEKLEPFDKISASETIDIINSHGDKCLKKYGTRIFFPSDEFYLTSCRKFPEYDYYEEFEQYENGVGMVVSFKHDFKLMLEDMEPDKNNLNASIITGEASLNLIDECMKKLKQSVFLNLNYDVISIRNDYFGPNITVTGLITGEDIIKQLSCKELKHNLIISSVMLRDDKFLDDITVSEVEQKLNVKCIITDGSPESLASAISKCKN